MCMFCEMPNEDYALNCCGSRVHSRCMGRRFRTPGGVIGTRLWCMSCDRPFIAADVAAAQLAFFTEQSILR